MIATPVIKANQSNTAPTESQLKLAISQVLSLPAAYNAPVIVLDFNVGDNGLVTGRFRDAARPRVFTYEIDDDGIAFKPFTPGRMDSLNVAIWESFSEGYTYRIDAVATKSKSRRQCVKPTAYNCGKSCININKTCKVNPKDATSSMRRKKLKAVVEEFKKAQKITPSSGEVTKLTLTPKPPEDIKPVVKQVEVQKVITKPETQQQAERAKRPNGYLVPIAGDSVYSVTGSLIGSKKWKAKVISVNPDGDTMVIEKGWEKTKSGKPSQMTVPTDVWTVEDDPQKQKDIDKNLAQKKEAEAKAEKLSKQSDDSIDIAIKSAIKSGTEKTIARDDLKKGDTFYLYRKMDRTGDHVKEKYEYTSDTFAKEILPDGSKESETHVLTPNVKITIPVGSLANPATTAKSETRSTTKTTKTKVIKTEDNSPPRPKLKSKDNKANQLYDEWLDNESRKIQGRDGQFQIKFSNGDQSVQGQIYGNFGVHEEKGKTGSTYSLTHLASGRALKHLDNQDQAKKAIIELNRSDIDWSLTTEELHNVPGIQGKMKKMGTLVDTAIESDKRLKESKSISSELEREIQEGRNAISKK